MLLNRQREKTNKQIAREAQVLMGVESERANVLLSRRKAIIGMNLKAYIFHREGLSPHP